MSNKSRYIKTSKPGVSGYRGEKGICYYIHYRIDGKQKQEKVGWDYEGYSLKMAAEIREERIRAIRHGDILANKKANTITIDEAFEKYTEWSTENEEITVKDDISVFREHIKPFFDKIPLKNIDLKLIESKKKIWIESRSPEDVGQTISLIHRIYDRMIKLKLYNGTNPIKVSIKEAANDKENKYLTRKEARKMFFDTKNDIKLMIADIKKMTTRCEQLIASQKEEVVRPMHFSHDNKNANIILLSLVEVIKHVRNKINKNMAIPQLGILLLAAARPGITQPEIQKALNMPQGTCSRNCSKLSVHIEKKKGHWTDMGYGLVELKDTTDGSGSLAVFLSKEGKELINELLSILK